MENESEKTLKPKPDPLYVSQLPPSYIFNVCFCARKSLKIYGNISLSFSILLFTYFIIINFQYLRVQHTYSMLSKYLPQFKNWDSAQIMKGICIFLHPHFGKWVGGDWEIYVRNSFFLHGYV